MQKSSIISKADQIFESVRDKPRVNWGKEDDGARDGERENKRKLKFPSVVLDMPKN